MQLKRKPVPARPALLSWALAISTIALAAVPAPLWAASPGDALPRHEQGEYEAIPCPQCGAVHPCAAAKSSALRLAGGVRTAPTEMQKLIDMLVCDLSLEVFPDEGTIEGTAVLRMRVVPDSLGLSAPLHAVELDLRRELEVTAVRLDGAAAEHDSTARHEDLIRIRLDPPPPVGDELVVEIDYGGTPPTDGWSGLHFRDIAGAPIVYSFGAPRGARCWWPTKDHPEDKADTVRVRVTVPEGFAVAGNGRLAGVFEGEGRTSFLWEETHPIASYLVAFSAHEYEITEDLYTSESGESMPLVFYNYPVSVGDWTPVQSRVASMIGVFAEIFGEYPFLDEKYGHAQIPFSGGMEHQTMTSLGSRSEIVVVHELAHQWWGNAVTCADFHHVWLNEGFATYSQALWREAVEGLDAYRDEITKFRYYGRGSVYVYDIEDSDRIFDTSLSYYKGAWVLHMLRGVLGDDDFFATLGTYYERHVGGTARTEDLREAAELVSGLDLDHFFHQWVYGEGFPIYTHDWTAWPAGDGYELQLRLRQLQSGTVFHMPVDLVVHSSESGQSQTFRVDNASADTTYALPADFLPSSIEVDPHEWILRRVIPPMDQPAFDRQILLVNGVPWMVSAGEEVRSFYDDHVFTGAYAYDFWDYHRPPSTGYPRSLPAPIGHGAIPADVLGRYEAVVWVANNYGGDGMGWIDSPLHGYLEAGGNAALMTLSGRTYLPDPFVEYLGISWEEQDAEAIAYRALHTGLPDLRIEGGQSPVSFFRLEDSPRLRPLYAAEEGSGTFLGVLRLPGEAGGGGFFFLSGRPYRWHPDDLRGCLSWVLGEFLPDTPGQGTRVRLLTSRPNPARDVAGIRFLLPEPGPARLGIWDVQGRRIRILRDAHSPAGWNAEIWDGLDHEGRRAPSGVYFSRLDAAGETRSARVLLMR